MEALELRLATPENSTPKGMNNSNLGREDRQSVAPRTCFVVAL